MDDDATTAAAVSPAARKLAEAHGIDLATIRGTGPGGRITKSDVEAIAGPADDAEVFADELRGAVRRTRLTRTQQIVVRRMVQAKSEVPEFTLETEIDMSAALALRSELAAAASGERPPSVNDMIVKACALALREHPTANGAYVDGALDRFERVNIGIAVAAPGTLVVPVVFDADRKSLGEISADARAAAERVRSGRVTPADLDGGTFTVSNLGMMGIRRFTAVINPPQAAILAVGAVVDRGGDRRSVMSATLTCDHRVLYGADGAALLSLIREHLESPATLAAAR